MKRLALPNVVTRERGHNGERGQGRNQEESQPCGA